MCDQKYTKVWKLLLFQHLNFPQSEIAAYFNMTEEMARRVFVNHGHFWKACCDHTIIPMAAIKLIKFLNEQNPEKPLDGIWAEVERRAGITVCRQAFQCVVKYFKLKTFEFKELVFRNADILRTLDAHDESKILFVAEYRFVSYEHPEFIPKLDDADLCLPIKKRITAEFREFARTHPTALRSVCAWMALLNGRLTALHTCALRGHMDVSSRTYFANLPSLKAHIETSGQEPDIVYTNFGSAFPAYSEEIATAGRTIITGPKYLNEFNPVTILFEMIHERVENGLHGHASSQQQFEAILTAGRNSIIPNDIAKAMATAKLSWARVNTVAMDEE